MDMLETTEIGGKGEDKVYEFLRKNGWIVLENDGALRQLSKIEIPENLTTLKLLLGKVIGTKFDFIARKGETVIMGDIKTKQDQRSLGIIDENKFKTYLEFMKVIPFLMFFYIREEWTEYYDFKLKKIRKEPKIKEALYVAMLRNPEIEPKMEPKTAPEIGIMTPFYIIDRKEMMEADEWAKKGCSLSALPNFQSPKGKKAASHGE